MNREPQPARRSQLVLTHLEGVVVTGPQLMDPTRVDVVTHDVQLLAELDRQRQADIAEPHHGDGRGFWLHHRYLSPGSRLRTTLHGTPTATT